MILASATKELHHAAERHSVGGSMADGTISEQYWADWLGALWVIHKELDPHLPVVLHRVERLETDLNEMELTPRFIEAAVSYTDILDPAGAAYVFTGAHLMGGAVMERKLRDRLPCAHLRWDDRQEALRAWRPMRENGDAADAAKAAFAAVISIMDEIVK
jgi:heme oxygenase